MQPAKVLDARSSFGGISLRCIPPYGIPAPSLRALVRDAG